MHSDKRKIFRTVFLSILGLFTFTVVVLFSWNSFAPDLFQLPMMQFKQAFGLVLFISCVSFLVRLESKHSLHKLHLMSEAGPGK